jgi:hypothetical protein
MRKMTAVALLTIAVAGGVAFVSMGGLTPGRISCASRPVIPLMPSRHCWRDPTTAVR